MTTTVEPSKGYFVPLPESNEDVVDRVLRRWTFDYILPLPKWDVKCPTCDSKLSDGDIQARHWNYHKRGKDTKGYRYRCDVHMKCRCCGLAFTFGIVVPDQFWRPDLEHGIVHYRQAYDILRKAGAME